MTRPRIRTGILSALLALLLQIAAPSWAILTIAAGSGFDPSTEAPICSAHQEPQPAGGSHHHAPTCPLCQVCCHASYLLTASPAAGPPLRLRVSHVEHDAGKPGLPRGPPRVAPNARAPPPGPIA
jgi:hypothetical protein